MSNCRPLATGLALSLGALFAVGCTGGPRPEFVEAVLKAEDTRDLDAFTSATLTGDREADRRLILAIGRIGDPRQAPFLASLLHEGDHPYSADAAFALGEMLDRATLAQYGHEPATSYTMPLAAMVYRGRSAERMRAVEALGKIGDPVATAVVRDVLAKGSDDLPHRDAKILRAAIVAAWRLGMRETAPMLIAHATSADRGVRLDALRFLSRMKPDATARGAAMVAIASGDADEGALGARLLGAIGDPRDVETLAPLAAGEDFAIAVEAINALGRIESPESAAALCAALEPIVAMSKEHGERFTVHFGQLANRAILIADALGNHATDERSTALLTPLLVRNDAVGYRSFLAFAKIANRRVAGGAPAEPLPGSFKLHDPIAVRAFLAGLAEYKTPWSLSWIDFFEDERDASLAAKELLRITLPERIATRRALSTPEQWNAFEPKLRAYLDHPDPVVRAYALAGLFPEADSVPATEVALAAAAKMLAEDSDVDARREALRLLSSRSENALARAALEGALTDPHPVLRREAMAALKIGSPENLAKYLTPWDGTFQRVLPVISQAKYLADMRARTQREVYVQFTMKDRGRFVVELYPEDAPVTVASFLSLARSGFFGGLTFHRVVPNFVIQGGDPRNDMSGGPGYTIPCEINTHTFKRGTLGMALSGKDTGGSQFFIALSPQPHLDGGYTVFGRVLEAEEARTIAPEEGPALRGLDVLDEIVPFDSITFVDVLSGL